MISKQGNDFDIVIITGEYYDDHPLSPVGIIARVLDTKGFSVGIIEKPEKNEDFTKMGKPRHCFCVTSGSYDSMVHNYTPLKRKRIEDEYSSVTKIPDRALLFYCNKIKQFFKTSKIVIGGIEASLRRFAHYDYWDNNLRRSILLDSRASILVYGNGEKQIIEIAERLKKGRDLNGIPGTCIVSKEKDDYFYVLPSYKEVRDDPIKFCIMQRNFSNNKDLAQEYDNNYVLQYWYPCYTSKDLDWIYSLPYTRKTHLDSLLKMAKFSVVTHRGCVGKCNFCALSLHQGERIISRSEESILKEIKDLTKHPKFKGYIDDLGGPSANMYGMDCIESCKSDNKNDRCQNSCLECSNLKTDHKKLISLLKKARDIKGVKKIFIRSGIRYDIALYSKLYIKEISDYHISGCLKIAPEHFSEHALKLMNKNNKRFDEFVSLFNEFNKDKKQFLKYYFMIGHPGDDLNEVKLLHQKIKEKNLKNIEQFQLFTPTPMTASSCMYWTGFNPFTLERVNIVYDYNTKKKLKRILLDLKKQEQIYKYLDY